MIQIEVNAKNGGGILPAGFSDETGFSIRCAFKLAA
jgi:hypothetical protein